MIIGFITTQTLIYVISMEFLSLRRRRPPWRNIPGGERRCETAVFQASKGAGDREKGKREGGRGERGRGSLPFPLFRAFLPHPLPPLFAPATQASIPRLINLWSKRQENLNVRFSFVQKNVDRKTRFHDKLEIRKADENRPDNSDRHSKRKYFT